MCDLSLFKVVDEFKKKNHPENILLSIQVWNQQTHVPLYSWKFGFYSYSILALLAVELSQVWINECCNIGKRICNVSFTTKGTFNPSVEIWGSMFENVS